MEKLNFTIQNSRELKGAVIITQFQKHLKNFRKRVGLVGQKLAVSIGTITCINLHSNMMILSNRIESRVRGYGIYLNRVNFSNRQKRPDSEFNLPSVFYSRGTKIVNTAGKLLTVKITYRDSELNLLEDEITARKKHEHKELILQIKTTKPLDNKSTGCVVLYEVTIALKIIASTFMTKTSEYYLNIG